MQELPELSLIEINVAGQSLKLPDLPRYRKFYDKLRKGAWEPRTFQVLAANLDSSTAYLDIGAWIGVTPFWASRVARRVIAVEPDPQCQAILSSLAPLYPNVELLPGAFSSEPTVTLNEVSGFGSSESSALEIGDGAAIAVPGYSVSAIMARLGGETIFAKIDIEGYEYRIMREIAALARYPLRGVQCAVHPQLYEKSLTGSRLARRLATLRATWRLWRLLKPLGPQRSVPRYRNIASYLLFGVLLRRSPKGTEFLILSAPSRVRKQRLTETGNSH